ncbi:hypothetical protein OIU78_026948 [Salix suchowensis]|nr:hypothetical protein OIU78_026948 [Salix suchowensis]
MDLSKILFQMIPGALVLLFLHGFWKTLAKKREAKKLAVAPEPSGAWPLIGHLPRLRGQDPACKTLATIADEYGPIYSLRLGSHRILVVSSWETVKDCLATNDRILATRANIAAGKHMGYNNAVFALSPYGKYWRDVRKLVTLQLLSSHRLELLKHVRVFEVDAFIRGLHSSYAEAAAQPATVSISKLFESLTFNISLRTIVGKRYCSSVYDKENSEPWRYKKAIEEALYLSGIFVISDAIPWLEWIDLQGHVSAMKRTSKELDAVIGSWLEEHLNKEIQGESDFMDVMISNLADGVEMSGYSRDVVIKATTLVRLIAVVVHLTLARLLQGFDLTTTAGLPVDMSEGPGIALPKLNPLQAVIKPRLGLGLY